MFTYYIQPTHYEQAEKNGISAHTLERRVRESAWPMEKATTTKPQQRTSCKEWADVAKENGISANSFYRRANQYGWSLERAATQPIQDRKGQAEHARKSKKRVYPLKILKKAKKNGIPLGTFRARVRLGWTQKDAATRPVMTKREIGLMAKGTSQRLINSIARREIKQ